MNAPEHVANLEAQLAELTTTLDELQAKAEHETSRAVALTRALRVVIGYVRRVDGFMYGDDQKLLREAEAILEEHGECAF